ncbi:MAG: TonB-dependent receptor [Sphingomonadales bacterium]|nr:TonB-dependent receptor [Sphingomonadales bacterium]
MMLDARAGCLAMLLGGVAAPALAQDAGAPILVTGTRIAHPGPARPEPLQVLDGARIQARGQTQVAEAINELPGFRSPATPAGTQTTFGQGVNFVNAFGLGTHRTLVLLDGQRMVTTGVPSTLGSAAPGTQLDLNTVPAILVARVEQVTASGAPVHGSDAIAGIVNIVLRRRFRGLDVRGTGGLAGQGDNLRRNVSALGGFDFAGGRGNVTAAFAWDKVAGVAGVARAYVASGIAAVTNPCTVAIAGQCGVANLVATLGPAGRTVAGDGRLNPAIGFDTSGSDGIPASIYVRDVTVPAVAAGGVLSNGAGAYGWRFDAAGDLVPYARGTLFNAPLAGALAAAALASGGDGLRAASFVSLASDQERYNGHLFASLDLDDHVALFAEAMIYDGSAHTMARQPTYNAVLFSGVSGALTFRVDNPFLGPAARERLAALGYGATFQLSRANADLVDLAGSTATRLYRAVAGVRGKLGRGAGAWGWEATVNFGQSDVTDRGRQIDEQRFINAVNVVAADGRAACSTVATVGGLPAAPVADPGCVPLDLFGDGVASPAALAYITRDTVSTTRLRQFVVNTNIGGELLRLRGNPVQANIGFEHHSESGRFTPDPFLQAGLGRAVAIAATAGGYALDEAFGEVQAPLVAPGNALPLVQRLELFARARHVSGHGGDFTALAAGGVWAPGPDFELRGNFTRSFRAPSIVEAFSPAAAIRVAVPDLCAAAAVRAGAAPAVRAANCAAFLARYPLASPLGAASASVAALSGGNPGLRDERAESWTAGIALHPGALPGLTLTADYVDFDIRDPIASLTVAQIASACFDNPSFDTSDPANGNRFCAMIPRDGNGQVLSDAAHPGVFQGYVNGQSIRMSGVQATLAWAPPVRLLGAALGIEGSLFWLRERVVDVTGVAAAASNGGINDPDWQGLLRLALARPASPRAAGWGTLLTVHYTGAQAIAATSRGPSPSDLRELDHLSPFATFDLAVWAETGDGLRLTLGATNLFDRVGQTYAGTVLPVGLNDPIGRRFTVGVQKRW